jgi:stage II sporulation protein AB (anti-sigma F factor)
MLNVINKMSIKLESRSINEGFARQTVAAFVAQLDPTVEELNDIKTIVSEAVTNAIVHGYRDRLGYITVAVRLLENRVAEIKVKDSGCGIPDIAQARQPLFTTGDEERSGMGFTIMESFTDRIHVRSAVGKGTLVTLVKAIHGKRTEDKL